MNSRPRPDSDSSPPLRDTRGTKRPVSITSNTSAGPSASTKIRIGSSGDDEPCWIAFVTASLIASFTS